MKSLEQNGRWRAYLAIALVSAGVMLFEVGVTRILSVVLWYHFAFLAVSLAMLGLGAPGVWYSLRPAGPRSLPGALLSAGLAAPAAIAVLFRFGSQFPYRVLLATVCILVPMLLLGSAVCILLVKARGREIGRMYAADLAGATLGALAVVPLMHVVPTPLIVAGVGILPLLALAVLGGRGRLPAVALLAAVAASLLWGAPYRLRFTKSYVEPSHLLYERWTPTARLTVFPTIFFVNDPTAGFGWGFGTKSPRRQVEQLWLEQDGSAGTPITRFDGSLAALDYLLFDVTSAGYQLRPTPKACVIGGGGGRDVLAALAAGTREVDVVELNGGIVELVSKDFAALSGDVYHLPGVRAVVSEGRSYLTHTPSRYDMIQISLIDSWAATTAGAFALSENYLYTVDAYRLYWNRLTPTGMISTSRWAGGTRRLESVRLAFLVDEALRQEGVPNPKEHYAIVQGGVIANILVSRAPFRGPLLDALLKTTEERGFSLLWPVTSAPENPMAAILSMGPGPLRSRGIDVSPTSDDRPFFFQCLDLLGRPDPQLLALLSVNEKSTILLRQLVGAVLALTVVLFFVPFLLGGRMVRDKGFWRGSFFFGAIGTGFMLVEIPLIQKAILYLGHPSHATTIVLASVLLGASLGSYGAGRIEARTVRRWGFFLPLVVMAGALCVTAVVPATLGWRFEARVAITFLAAGAMGLFMGFAFPSGMLRFDERNKAWFWAVNGATSVTASVLCLALSMKLGFTAVWLAGAAVYLVAWLLLGRADPGAYGPSAKE